tara:strand:+ start:1011 stop:1223 length:213 start_codon:yes stop_codon:yes gene_type:complete
MTKIPTFKNRKQIDNYLRDKDSDPIVLKALQYYVDYPLFGYSLEPIDYNSLNAWIESQLDMFWSAYEKVE